MSDVVECDTDTDIFARIIARKSRVSDVRMYRRVGRIGVGVGVVECGLYRIGQPAVCCDV